MWATKRTEFMKSDQNVRKIESLLQKTALLVLLATAAGLPAIQQTEAAANVVVWDTVAHFADAVDVADKAGWKPVPTDLLTLEADPPKAASDPGYYGREYSFKGDAVVENRSLAAVFWSAKGRVVLYSKADAALPGSASPAKASLGKKILEFTPRQAKAQPGKISRCEILRNAGDEVVLEVSFTAEGSMDASATFTFGRDAVVEIKPSEQMRGIRLLSPIEYGIVPGFIGDDLVFGPSDYSSADTLCLPVENLFVGLLGGEDNELVMTWPKGKQQLTLRLANDPQGKRLIESLDFDNDGQSFYLAALTAPGIWHREELKPTYLEKDVALTWNRPFAAKWKTQLTEADV